MPSKIVRVIVLESCEGTSGQMGNSSACFINLQKLRCIESTNEKSSNLSDAFGTCLTFSARPFALQNDAR